MATRINRRNGLYGFPNPITGLQQEPIVAQRAPGDADNAELGTIWVDQSAESFYILTNRANGVSVWTAADAGAITATSMEIDPGDLTVVAGDVDITLGDLNMDPASTATLGTINAGDITANGTLDVIGATTMTDLAVTGNVTITGDFDITDVASISITSTNDAAGAITLLTNGGTSETLVIQSAQGTGAGAITLDAVAGGVTIQGALGTADAINIAATDAAGGIDIDYGTGGMAVTGANGAFNLETGTGAINIGADAAQHAMALGNSTGTTSIALNTGTGTSLNLGTNAIAHTVTIGNITGATVVAVNAGTAGAGAVNIATTANATPITIGNNTGATSVSVQAGTAGAGAINIGSTANAVPIVIGNVTGATSVAVNSGTGGIAMASTGAGDITLTSGDTVLVDSAGVLELNSSAGVIGIGNDAVAQNINVGTGAAARVITIGNVSGASQVVLNSGTAGVQFNTTGAGDVDVNSADDITIDAGGLISIDSAEASNFTVTGAAQDLTLSSAGGSVVITASEAVADAVVIQASNAAGGVVIDANGLVAVDPDVATVASPTAASTQDFRVIRTIFTGFTTAMAASQAFTITSNKVLTTSGCMVQVTNLNASGNGAIMTLDGVTQAAGSLVVHTTNNGAGALGAGDNVLITVWIIS